MTIVRNINMLIANMYDCKFSIQLSKCLQIQGFIPDLLTRGSAQDLAGAQPTYLSAL